MALPFEFKTEIMTKDGRVTWENIEEVRKWLESTSIPPLQEEFIALFLLSCSNDVERAKKTIVQYFKNKSEGPELFFGRDIDCEELQNAMNNVVVAVSIPARMPDNTVIHFFKLTDTNYKHFDLVLSMKLAFMVIDVSQRYNPPTNLVVVMDMQGVGLMHLTCVKMGAIKKFMEYLQEAMPLKIQKIHILNTNYIFDKALAIVKMFMKGELMSMLMAHPPKMEMSEFHEKWIPASCLPKEYGGDLPSVEELNQMMIQQFRERKEFYQAEENLIRNYNNS